MSRVKRKRFQIAWGALVMMLTSLLATSSAASQAVSGQRIARSGSIHSYDLAASHYRARSDAYAYSRDGRGCRQTMWPCRL